jgi:hypothetical protein
MFRSPDHDTTRRAESHDERWQTHLGPCRIYSCQESAVDTSGRCAEHTEGAAL